MSQESIEVATMLSISPSLNPLRMFFAQGEEQLIRNLQGSASPSSRDRLAGWRTILL
jgi:hypothetical protein